jgi:hypothetical protein
MLCITASAFSQQAFTVGNIKMSMLSSSIVPCTAPNPASCGRDCTVTVISERTSTYEMHTTPGMVPIKNFKVMNRHLIIKDAPDMLNADFDYVGFSFTKNGTFNPLAICSISKTAKEVDVRNIYAFDFLSNYVFTVTKAGVFIGGKKVESIIMIKEDGPRNSVVLRQNALASLFVTRDSANTISDAINDSLAVLEQQPHYSDAVHAAMTARYKKAALFTWNVTIQYYQMRLRDDEDKVKRGLAADDPAWTKSVKNNITTCQNNIAILNKL